MAKKPRDMSIEETEAELDKTTQDAVRLELLKKHLEYLLTK